MLTISHSFGGNTTEPTFIQSDLDILLQFKCSTIQQQELVKPFTNDEIREVFFALPKNKTSGLDGYSAEFFVAC